MSNSKRSKQASTQAITSTSRVNYNEVITSIKTEVSLEIVCQKRNLEMSRWRRTSVHEYLRGLLIVNCNNEVTKEQLLHNVPGFRDGKELSLKLVTLETCSKLPGCQSGYPTVFWRPKIPKRWSVCRKPRTSVLKQQTGELSS